MKTTTTVLLALALAAPTLALAHDDATLDAMESPNGGQVRMAGPYHFELVLGENAVSVFLTDHGDAPVPSEGVGGNVILMSGGRTTIALEPVDSNRLAGEGAFEKQPDMKAVVSLTFPDGQTWQARFTPGAQAGQVHSATDAAPADSNDHAHHH
ncbi:hypothetical protein [Thiocapsa rosea]|uniref:Uncharacterized protein n=1 Tax=Thiocapsa rosea TaxID=69360 RepID=A0A495V5L1_9GAMM|nr:hypothetical protein [Thiocapsa rosea]RKT43088.1 hypothetical protein BDD21_0398 [Thiocapsa rosea]